MPRSATGHDGPGRRWRRRAPEWSPLQWCALRNRRPRVPASRAAAWLRTGSPFPKHATSASSIARRCAIAAAAAVEMEVANRIVRPVPIRRPSASRREACCAGPARPRTLRGAMKAEFRFASEGEVLVGNLFLPSERSKPAGAVVVVGPLTSVKEQAAGTYARAMAERGYAALRAAVGRGSSRTLGPTSRTSGTPPPPCWPTTG